ENFVERLSRHEFEDQESLAAVLLDPVDRRDVGMVQRREKSRLALEARQRRFVMRKIGRQRLDRDFAAEARIGGAVDMPHSSGAQRIDDFVGADASTGCDVQCCNYTTAAVR